MNFELKQHFQIESARSLPHLPKTHPCSRVHGHSFKIILTLKGPLDPVFGWVQDYHEIAEKFKPLLKMLDHNYLNDIKGLENPTSEKLAEWIFANLKSHLPLISRVTVCETSTTECSYPA